MAKLYFNILKLDDAAALHHNLRNHACGIYSLGIPPLDSIWYIRWGGGGHNQCTITCLFRRVSWKDVRTGRLSHTLDLDIAH